MVARLNIRTQLLLVIVGKNVYLLRKLAKNSTIVAEVADSIGLFSPPCRFLNRFQAI